MKKTQIWLFVFFIALLALGYYLGWLDNGPRTLATPAVVALQK